MSHMIGYGIWDPYTIYICIYIWIHIHAYIGSVIIDDAFIWDMTGSHVLYDLLWHMGYRVCIYIYTYIYIHVHTYIYGVVLDIRIHTYIYGVVPDDAFIWDTTGSNFPYDLIWHIGHDSFTCEMTYWCVPWLIYLGHDEFIWNDLFICHVIYSCPR